MVEKRHEPSSIVGSLQLPAIQFIKAGISSVTKLIQNKSKYDEHGFRTSERIKLFYS